MSKENETLGGFSGWDEDKIPSNFFDDSPEDLKTEAIDVLKELEKDDEPEEDKGSKGKEKTAEQLAEELFNDEVSADVEEVDDEDEPEDNENNTKTKAKNTKGEKGTLVSAVSLLKEKGIIDFELEEGEELTEELADEILEDKYEESVESRIEELFGDLPDIVKQINKYAMQGGDLNKFFNSLTKQNAVGISADMDLENESNQETVVKAMLKDEGYDDEYIDTQLEFLKDSNKLKAIAEKKLDVWKTKNQKEQAKLLEDQAKAQAKQKEDLRKEKVRLSTLLSEKDEVQGIKLSKQDKKDLPSYILDRNIKLDNGAVISPIHKDIYEVMSNETAVLQLAKMLRTRNKDGSFNFKEIEMIAKTKVAQEVRENVRRNKTNTPTKSVSRNGSSQTKSLADYF